MLSRHEQVPRMQGWLWKGQSSPHTVVNWNGAGGISAAGLAGKHQLRVAILSLASVPGLGASSLGWGAAKLWHSCPVRARREIDAFCAREEENTVAVTVGGHTSQSTEERLSQVSLLSAETAGKAARVAQIYVRLRRVGQAEQNTRKIFLQVPSWVCPDTTPPCLRKARVWLLRALFVH